METPTSVPEVVAWIGLDWADQRHEIRLAAAGSAGIESFTVEQKPAALHAWVGGLRARFPEGQIAVAERREFYDRHRRLSTQEREDLFRQIDQAQPLTRDQALVQASALMAQGLAEQLHGDRGHRSARVGAGETLCPAPGSRPV